jgi:hypothetical protein
MITPDNGITPEFLVSIDERLRKMKMTANWTGGSLIALGIIAISSSLFISAFADQMDILFIKIIAFASTLSITLIGAFNLSTKAGDTRNGWKYLNKAVMAYKANVIDAATLIKAYEDSENLLGSVDFNYSKPELPKSNTGNI